ncbi:probable carbohydrate esterase At4g34215 [Rhododendron vialii]|uniref:probable carbohydrate esterase At4g34215 n=1 Tax=Rhododendron vialii TaxID=182163 RepID=UPI00265EAEC2|nr:probable carbohydrate esterase At4g34215 [Rhododendron vialii]
MRWYHLLYIECKAMFTFLWVILIVAHALPVTPVSSQDKNIFLLAGQSNMAGNGGVINGTWDGVVPPECGPNPSVLRLAANLTWVPAAEPLHKDIGGVNAAIGVGPGMSFANSVLARDPSLGVVGLVPCAYGGTKISQWGQGSFLYDQLVSRARAAVRGGGGKIQAMLWYQGESDAVLSEDAELYKGRLQKFFQDLRLDLQSPSLLIIQVALASESAGPYTEKVREAQLGLDLANVKCVDAKGLELQSDNLHLSTPAEVQLGKMLAGSFLQNRPNPLTNS